MRQGPWSDVGPTGQVAGRFSHATWMVGALVGPSEDRHLDEAVRLACLEDWFLNYRLLAEFLIGGPKESRASAETFVLAWSAKERPWREHLGRELNFASAHVAHIGKPTDGPPVDISPEALRAKAELLLEAVAESVAVLPRRGHDSETMRGGLADARRALNAR